MAISQREKTEHGVRCLCIIDGEYVVVYFRNDGYTGYWEDGSWAYLKDDDVHRGMQAYDAHITMRQIRGVS